MKQRITIIIGIAALALVATTAALAGTLTATGSTWTLPTAVGRSAGHVILQAARGTGMA